MGDPRGEDGEAVGECQDVRAGGRGEVNKTKVHIQYTCTGWWFGTCFIFPYIGNNHPN